MFRHIITFISLLLLSACANLPWTLEPPAQFDIQVNKPADRIAFGSTGRHAQFDIYSASGIGGAQFTQSSGAAPLQITLRLHLRALEGFKLSFDDQVIQIEIPTNDTPTPRASVTSDSPLYPPVAIVSQGELYPIQDGYIQIELPRAYFQAEARAFAIEWIDFHR